ncbi:Regulator of chromosome condensation beta-lactamase-inhibitor II [Fusarium albosuccineum]|uniref:Regulator of chromosome condensation beta-lactamase-inhibitor II n=1 Tax=Fusarium albosuccineum TaxID=1237068 RepID=A0A8H4PDM3_9HYPO|nr:Regulator of chromosome condensation beta-lactamase-inhibitor II [Fusarium albosuccineum]
MPSRISSAKRSTAWKSTARVSKKTSEADPKKRAAVTQKSSTPKILKPSSRSHADNLPNGTTSVAPLSGKRKQTSQIVEQRQSKKAKTAPERTRTNVPAPRISAPLNQAPTQILSVFPFGNGENSELGLGIHVTEALTAQPNTYLGPPRSSSLGL